jgi:tetratricopeptide (TPR) repeat protein
MPAALVQVVLDRYELGLALQGYALGHEHGPLSVWQPVEAQVLAGRLAYQLGAPRLARWLHRCAYRSAPDRAEPRYYYAMNLVNSQGPYAAWRWIHLRGELPADANAEVRSSRYALIGNVAAALRDFDTAETWLKRAREAAPESAWALVCLAHLREADDRYDEALALAQEALALRSWYRPAVQAAAHLLALLSRDAAALELLTEANAHIESGPVAAQLYLLQNELRDFPAAARTLDRFVELSPLLEKAGRQWLPLSGLK